MPDNRIARAIDLLLNELLHGPAEGGWSFVLNPGDPGILPTLAALSAEEASRRPLHDRPPLAAHANHLRYSLELLNRWVGGEANPWATADWATSWRVERVDAAAWRTLLADLRREAEAWIAAPKPAEAWDDIALTGALAATSHLAYHLGAIRQIIAHRDSAA